MKFITPVLLKIEALFDSYRKLENFEKWQVSLGIVGILAGSSVAGVIGWKQIGISTKQNDIAEKQNKLQEATLALNYEPSLAVNYNKEERRWEIHNTGKERISIFNIILKTEVIEEKFRGEKSFWSSMPPGRSINAGNLVKIEAVAVEELIKEMNKKSKVWGMMNIPLEILVKTANEKDYRVIGLFTINYANGNLISNTEIYSYLPINN